MSHSLSHYNALYESMRARRRRTENHKGLDKLVHHAHLRAQARKVTLAWLRREGEAIDRMTADVRAYSDGVLDDAIGDVRDAFLRARQTDETVRHALALVREAARRETGEEAFIVQLMGALALYHGRIIEMLTGEGKTLTGSLAAPLLAWRHRYLHVFTVNDYLARRDAQSRAGIYKRCALAVGAIQQEQEPDERAELYARPILYATPKQVTADWLRDQLRLGGARSPWEARTRLARVGALGDKANDRAWTTFGPLIPGLRAALVDEADAALIDEGVVPLIIARARREDDMADVYRQACAIASSLDEGPDYAIDHLRRRATMKDRGRHRLRNAAGEYEASIWRAPRRAEELVRQGLVARHCYLKGRQYQVVDGQVVIVDEYTGRFLPDRSWEHGLHQAVEAKENMEITADRETLARLSFQRFFRSYPALCGMTGTASDAAREMEQVYARPVAVIPTNRPMVRAQWPTRVFAHAESKWSAILESIRAVHAEGRPILVGTRSIEASEHLSSRLSAQGLEHQVLNALHDDVEADLIAGAGHGACITVATNMAGRGTDIVLDERARAAGGLHVILTEMHTARRIDRQFIGRAGRQGDPGSAQIFVSLDDELIRLHGWNARTRPATTDELTGAKRSWAMTMICRAQRSAEARSKRGRASVLRQDDWIDRHLPGA